MGETNTIYDLIVIGGGPAGYPAAIRASQLGKKVACIEMERPGGTCLNWGCIPSKALLKSAQTYQELKHSAQLGIRAENIGFDFTSIIQRSRQVADKMAAGIEFLFKKNKIDHFSGTAHITAPGLVEIRSGKDKDHFFKTHNILIATGCKPVVIGDLQVDGKKVMTSREALVTKELPASIVILGAGAIGVEFAYFFNALGSKVTLVEMQSHILPVEDHEVSSTLSRSLQQQGISIYTHTKAQNIKLQDNGVSLDLIEENKTQNIHADSILLAVGVRPYLKDLLSPQTNITLCPKGYIQVNDNYQTNIPGIYAAGDIIGPPWLAHVATFEATQAVNGMFNHSKPKRHASFPGCTYCQPQVASVGLTEQAAKEKGIDYNIGKFPFMASGKAVAIKHPEGFVKIISSKEYGEILGAHIIGVEATELINELNLAIQLEATIDDLHNTIHAHPTLSESICEAAGATHNQAIHI